MSIIFVTKSSTRAASQEALVKFDALLKLESQLNAMPEIVTENFIGQYYAKLWLSGDRYEPEMDFFLEKLSVHSHSEQVWIFKYPVTHHGFCDYVCFFAGSLGELAKQFDSIALNMKANCMEHLISQHQEMQLRAAEEQTNA